MKKQSRLLVCIVSVALAINLFYAKSANAELAVVASKHEFNLATVGHNNHPRLFVGVDDIPALQTQAATTHREIWLPIQDYVDSQLGNVPPAASAADDSLSAYRNYGNMLIPFAFACVITGEVDYCDLAKTYLLTFATWEQWGENNYRDLGHAHMLLGNAIAYDWLYNILTPAERQIVRASLAGWAQKMYEASSEPFEKTWGNWWRKSYLQNHHWINNSALGMAGLVLLGEHDRAQTWIDQASSQMSRVQYILDGIADGSWHESIQYQNYGLTLSLPFLVNLKRIQGVDLLPDEYLYNYPYWRLYNHIPNSTRVILAYGNFEWEWGNGYQPQNLLRFVADEYENGHAEWVAQKLAAYGRYANVWSTPWYVFEFLYYDPTIEAQLPTGLQVRTFPDLKGVIWRTGWEDDDLIFGLKTGAFGGRFAFDTFTQELYPWDAPCAETGCQLNVGHDHDDANTFYIYRAGSWLAPETVGVDQYATAFHNTLLIDGQGQYRVSDFDNPDDFRGSDGFLQASANTTCFDYVAADATRRYKNIAGVQDVTRHVLFVRPGYFVMLDNLTATATHEYVWVSHFGQSVSVEDNWVRGDADDQQTLGVGIVSPSSFQTITGDDGKAFVHISPTSPTDDARFINVLYPTEQAAWDAKPTVSLIEDNGEAAATSVQWDDGSSDAILLTYAETVGTRSLGPYQYDAQAAIVARDPQDKLDKLFVYGGTFVKDQAQDTVLVTNLEPDESFEAIYFDQTVAVNGNIVTEVTLYAPLAQSLFVNRRLAPFNRSGDYITFDGSGPGMLRMLIINVCVRPVAIDTPPYLPIILKAWGNGAGFKMGWQAVTIASCAISKTMTRLN